MTTTTNQQPSPTNPTATSASSPDYKSQGNKAFSSGDYNEATRLFSLAIQHDPHNHLLYSNRSAAYASLKNYTAALDDAEKTVALNPGWSKGYGRKGAALFGLGKWKEAEEAYEAGLAIDGANAQLVKGLQDVKDAMQSAEANSKHSAANPGSNPFANIFGPDMWTKLATNPKLSPYLAQPDVMAKLRDVQANPDRINMYMQDPRMMNIMMGLMGLDGFATTNPDEVPRGAAGMGMGHEEEEVKEGGKSDVEAMHVDEKKGGAAPAKSSQPEPALPVKELSEEEKAEQEAKAAKQKAREESDKLKAQGNDVYKKKQFDQALALYDQAYALDDTNVAVLSNKAAVLFEMGNFEECIQIGHQAVDRGRELFTDYKLMARILGRIGSAHERLDHLDQAIKSYHSSLAEHRTPDILAKLRAVEKLKSDRAREAYRDPVLADQARDEGNVLFKQHDYAGAVAKYEESIKRNDTDPRGYSNRAAALAKLMALPEAERDCDKAIALDPGFIKAYIRKAAILFAKKEYSKAIEVCEEGKVRDVDKKHHAELDGQIYKCYVAQNPPLTSNAHSTNASGASREEILANAMKDPQVQQILSDPVMQTILQSMQEDPKAAAEHMKNAEVARKIRVLVNAGVLSVR